METIRFDEIDRLKTKISTEFGPWSKPIEITQEKINQFADVTGDHQWIHIDVERCKRESPFGGHVAHAGWKVVGYRNVVNYGANKLRFISPVPAGAKVQARQRIVGVEQRPQGTQITTESQIQVVGSDRPAVIYEGIFLYVK